jgi:hypothetical protein
MSERLPHPLRRVVGTVRVYTPRTRARSSGEQRLEVEVPGRAPASSPARSRGDVRVRGVRGEIEARSTSGNVEADGGAATSPCRR